ncbi:MAG TPA: stage V sporulation protein AC [Candidatus Avimonoglobus intestinipullorum]|uniref:Stage V sporulation protein AC n=1 Tax=Candidatus Avimonoglobus intestinipullorum TaxID=2840699 RepID=A0A9D1LV76_9FIRM|nr:stage V sporulation protein AC [Candidatus Avimonoglobus intestinipullorum]
MAKNMTQDEYKKIMERKTPASKLFTNCIKAFLIGGLICCVGQFFLNFYTGLGLEKELAAGATSMTMIFLGVLLTGLDIYPKIAKHAGAGTIVPITGFANSVASPAIEAKTEGLVLGVGAKLFTIAGPVIVYGTIASVVAGVIFFFMG